MSERSDSKIAFISLLRAAAALLVVWDHLVGCMLEVIRQSWGPLDVVERYVNGPLGITEHFGFFGVGLFFLISGFIITHVAQREDRLTFGVKRVFRIYPPMIASIILIPLVWNCGRSLFQTPAIPKCWASVDDKLWSCTLLNYFIPGKYAVSLVTWSLAIEVMFYAICVVLLPLLQRRPRLAIACELGIVAILFRYVSDLGPNSYRVAMMGAFLPCLLLGQIVYYTWAGRLRFAEYAMLSAGAYFLFVKGQIYFWPNGVAPGSSRGVSLGYAYAVFVVSMLLSDRIRLPQAVRGISEVSYSLYLWHDSLGRVIILGVQPLVFPAALALALVGCFIVSYLSYRLIERPSQVLARRLLAWWRPPATAHVLSLPVTSMPVSRAA